MQIRLLYMAKCKPIFTLFVKVFTVFTQSLFWHLIVYQHIEQYGILLDCR